MRTKACSVPFILAALAVLSCVFLVHGLYGLIELFGSPDLSPEAMLLIFAFCFLVLAAAAAAATTTTSVGYRRALLPREEAVTTQDYPGSGANSRHDPRNPH
ncbi:hypothetical protein E2562_020618 [Oryza meyeriana var. granulata]|uniref:Uncharacterized protein n=1 Tax=Oryza meyeriana var. granulata TaxID=110450 RepID=A0A6G1DYF8_9ORYZ|nr:hypothetical protein E2562_020618 [Oryza meyeriana var. granulata]